MATSATWCEYTGTGPTEAVLTANINSNWMSTGAVDTTGSLYANYPITAGQPSFHKIQALKFANALGNATATISQLSYTVSVNSATGTGGATAWTVKAATSMAVGYVVPIANVLTGAPGNTIVTMPTSGATLWGSFGTAAFTANGISTSTGPFCTTTGGTTYASSTASIAAGAQMYGSALWTQLVTTGAAVAGAIPAVTITANWTEA